MSPNRPTITPGALRRYTDAGYVRPTGEDLRALKALSGQTGAELAALAGVGPRTWRKWTAPPGTGSYRPIPYSAWRLLLIELNII